MRMKTVGENQERREERSLEQVRQTQLLERVCTWERNIASWYQMQNCATLLL